MNEEPMLIKADKDGNVIVHRPIINKMLSEIDQWIFHASDKMEAEDMVWCLNKVDKLYLDFEDKFSVKE